MEYLPHAAGQVREWLVLLLANRITASKTYPGIGRDFWFWAQFLTEIRKIP